MSIEITSRNNEGLPPLQPGLSPYGRVLPVDWDGVYDALLPVVTDIPSDWGVNNYTALREFRTIRMGGGRQNGKRSWAVDRLATPGYIIVAKDKDMRQSIDRMYCLKNPQQVIKITIPADCPNPYDVVEEYLNTFRKNSYRKVFTVMDLQTIAAETPEKLAHVTHVIIADASFNTRTGEVFKVFAGLKMFKTIFVALN